MLSFMEPDTSKWDLWLHSTHSFNRCLLSTYYVLGARDQGTWIGLTVNKTDKLPTLMEPTFYWGTRW